MRIPYADILQVPSVPRLLAAAIVGRMHVGMGALAVFLLVRSGDGTYSTAGLAVGAATVAGAVGAPIFGRLIDRFGQPRVLLPVAIAQATTLVLLAALAPAGGPTLFVLCGVYGLSAPPIAAGLRAIWGTLLPEQGLLTRAFALDSTVQETIWVMGPVLTATLAGTLDPRAPILAMAGFTLVGVIWFSTTPVSRSWRTDHTGERHLLGPLTSSAVRRVLLTTVGLAFSWGSLELTIAAYADHTGISAGPLLAVWAVGSVIGGMLFAARAWRQTPQRLLMILLALNATGFVALLTASSPWSLALLLLVTGTVNAPVIGTLYVLINGLAPRGTVTEACTWITTMVLVGISAGVATAGVVADLIGPRGGFLLAIAGGTVAVFSTLIRRSGLYPPPDTEPA